MKECCVDGCNGKVVAKGMCDKHYRQMKRHGYIKETTRLSANKFEIKDDIVEIVLYDNDGNECNRAIINKEDLDKVKGYKWGMCHNYVSTLYNRKRILLHRFIVDCEDGMMVDHIDGNPLNNTRSNLRIVTPQQNALNKDTKGIGNNKRMGVTFDKRHNKWLAKIQVDKKEIYLGMYNTEEEAIKAREEAEIKYFGEYRRK